MEGSEAYYCLLCAAGAISGFNCGLEDCVEKIRTTENMEAALLEYLQKSATSRSIKNVDGVNNKRMIPLNVTKVLVPILHYPMGLVDKLLESFTDYVWKNVLLLPPEDDLIRKRIQETDQQLASSKILLQSKREASKSKKDAYNESKTPANEEEHKRAQEEESIAQAEKNKAVGERAKAKKGFDKMISSHCRQADSFTSKLEATYRLLGISREYYHGGKFNGVNCIQIMDKSDDIFYNAGTLLINLHDPALETAKGIQQTVKDYKNLMGCLDAIWPAVRGLDLGLLPTPADLVFLEKAIAEGKRRWLELGLSTLLPKWHLTFDGHLLHCVTSCGGLADKSDEAIEKGHQEWKRLQDRFCRIRNFLQQQKCIIRAWRRQQHYSIVATVAEFESKKAQA
jgi:hypothetical protein